MKQIKPAPKPNEPPGRAEWQVGRRGRSGKWRKTAPAPGGTASAKEKATTTVMLRP